MVLRLQDTFAESGAAYPSVSEPAPRHFPFPPNIHGIFRTKHFGIQPFRKIQPTQS